MPESEILNSNFSPIRCVTLNSPSTNSAQGEATEEMRAERAIQTKYSGNVAHEYSSVRDEQFSSPKPVEQLQKEALPASINLEARSSEELASASTTPDSPAGTASRWASIRTGFQNFRTSIGSGRFLRSSPSSNASATESLDEIFRKLKRSSSNEDADHLDDDGLP